MRVNTETVPAPQPAAVPAAPAAPVNEVVEAKVAPQPATAGRATDGFSDADASRATVHQSPPLRRAAATLERDPTLASTFISQFDAQLGLSPATLDARHQNMADTALSFYRANPALFYADLGGAYAGKRDLLDRPAPRITIDGDAHLGNFGTFRSASGDPVWGLNDFDQAGKGTPEADLERFATSVALTAREIGLSPAEEKAAVAQASASYFAELHRLATTGDEPPGSLTKAEASGEVDDVIKKAGKADRKDFLAKIIDDPSSTAPHFLTTDEIKPVTAAQRSTVTAALAEYAKTIGPGAKAAVPLQILDVAQKVGSGGSSFGLARYEVLVANADPTKKPVVLEVKQCLPSPIDDQRPDLHRVDANQIVAAQEALGGRENPLTGSAKVDGFSFLVREWEPEKKNIDPEDVKGAKDLNALVSQAAVVLARAHGQNGQAKAIDAWVGSDAATASQRLSAFATAYADQVTADFKAFQPTATVAAA